MLEDEGGAPAAGAWGVPVFGGGAVGDAAGPGAGDRTDPQGRFELDRVPVGPLQLIVQGAPGGPYLLAVEMPPGPAPADLGRLRLPSEAPAGP